MQRIILPLLAVSLTLVAAAMFDRHGFSARWIMPLLWTVVVIFSVLELRRDYWKVRAFWMLFGLAILAHLCLLSLFLGILFPRMNISSIAAVLLTFTEVYLLSVILNGKNIRRVDHYRSK